MSILSTLFAKSTKDLQAICSLDIDRYLGTWYEIARLPHAFESGMQCVTAAYNMRPDGKIEVINSGIRDGEKKVARGVAWIAEKNCSGRLWVSFFRPFRGEYRVILLDENQYRYAVVTSSTMNYLWILNREPMMSQDLYEKIIEFVSGLGFDISKIIKVDQGCM